MSGLGGGVRKRVQVCVCERGSGERGRERALSGGMWEGVESEQLGVCLCLRVQASKQLWGVCVCVREPRSEQPHRGDGNDE